MTGVRAVPAACTSYIEYRWAPAARVHLSSVSTPRLRRGRTRVRKAHHRGRHARRRGGPPSCPATEMARSYDRWAGPRTQSNHVQTRPDGVLLVD